jgi:two-component system, OmpR family, response regulator VicR
MAERPHVLYVDDEKAITDLMTVALGSEGFDVTVANDGQAAIEALSGKPKIDAIVLDYMMPKLDGLQFLERVSQNPELHAIKVILCSGAFPDQQEWWNRLGGSMRSIIKGCVQKPCDGPMLAKAIHAALGTPSRPSAASFLDEADEAPPPSMPISDGAVRMLVVEDDNVFGPAITEKLRSQGYGVGWCMTRKAMREFIPKRALRLPFDILLLDLALPDAFGSEIIRELALDPRSSGLKIVIITGHLAQGEEETFLSQLEPKARALVASILIKPYEWNSLLATIAQVAAKLPK